MSKHMSETMEWDEVVHLATAAYNFFPNKHSRERTFSCLEETPEFL